jgi:NADPH:quinone reductase-like Zn-dependent oxidoreductase
VPGITYDGGYAEYMIAPAEALALVPDALSAVVRFRVVLTTGK